MALDAIRGGSAAAQRIQGLQVSFGIERSVYINGVLMTTTSLNVHGGARRRSTASAASR